MNGAAYRKNSMIWNSQCVHAYPDRPPLLSHRVRIVAISGQKLWRMKTVAENGVYDDLESTFSERLNLVGITKIYDFIMLVATKALPHASSRPSADPMMMTIIAKARSR